MSKPGFSHQPFAMQCSSGSITISNTILLATADASRVEAPTTIGGYLMVAFAAMGGLFFGYDSGYLNGIMGMPYFVHHTLVLDPNNHATSTPYPGHVGEVIVDPGHVGEVIVDIDSPGRGHSLAPFYLVTSRTLLPAGNQSALVAPYSTWVPSCRRSQNLFLSPLLVVLLLALLSA